MIGLSQIKHCVFMSLSIARVVFCALEHVCISCKITKKYPSEDQNIRNTSLRHQWFRKIFKTIPRKVVQWSLPSVCYLSPFCYLLTMKPLSVCAHNLIKELPSNRPLASRNQRVVTQISAADVISFYMKKKQTEIKLGHYYLPIHVSCD